MGWVGRCLAVPAICWLALSAALAQGTGGANTQSAGAALMPAPASSAPKTFPHPAAAPANCEREIADARIGAPSTVVVQLDPDTLWRPRGTELRFTLSSTSGPPPQIKRVMACFRWQLVHDEAHQSNYTPSPLVRSVPNINGAIEYGALIPNLKSAKHSGTGPSHAGAVEYTAVYTVPVAAMQVLVEMTDGTWFAVVLPVGVTQVATGLIILAVALLIAIALLWAWTPASLLVADPPAGPGRVKAWNVSRHALAMISTSNGVASLSQFQIILWSFTVGGAAVYVMSLSGNLIAISTGTLTLLGIAGGTSVLARIPPPKAKTDVNQAGTVAVPPAAVVAPVVVAPVVVAPAVIAPAVVPAVVAPAVVAPAVVAPAVVPAPVVAPAAAAVVRRPRWSQILVDDAKNPEIDVTRVQMLIFTLISAAFVAITVATSYSIPEIPSNFLLLMGISNGVYLAGRQIPSTPKGTTS